MPGATLTCKQCGHVNEAERVYCHNCGAKLDRSLLPPDAAKSKETVEQARRRIQRMVTPQRGFFTGWQRALLNTVFWALLISAVIQMVRKPDGVPKELTRDEFTDTPPLATILEENLNSPTPQRIAITEELLNKYLAATVKPQAGGALSDVVKFDRTFVNLSEGVCRVTLQHSLFGYPLFLSSCYRPGVSGNALTAVNEGGNIGRLPIHPQLMQYSNALFEKLWDALKREHTLMDKLQSVEVHSASDNHPAQLVLVTKPAARR